MARGPKPDANQAAKGFPGRRKAKAKQAAVTAAKLATVLAFRDARDVDLPGYLQDPLFAPAAAIWRKLAPELRRTHRLPVEAEFNFIRFCVYSQEWFDATSDLHANGFSQEVATVAGGVMERRRPKVFDRQQAHQDLTELSTKFGLTPGDMYVLFKGQAAVAVSNPGLFGEDRRTAAPATPVDGAAALAAADDEVDQSAAPTGRIGGLAALRSAPPTKPN